MSDISSFQVTASEIGFPCYDLTRLVRNRGINMVTRKWQLQDAKARFSELVKYAQSEGPQEVTLHGRSVVMLVSRELYDKLTGNNRSFVEFMMNSPLCGAEDLVFERDQSLTREVDL